MAKTHKKIASQTDYFKNLEAQKHRAFAITTSRCDNRYSICSGANQGIQRVIAISNRSTDLLKIKNARAQLICISRNILTHVSGLNVNLDADHYAKKDSNRKQNRGGSPSRNRRHSCDVCYHQCVRSKQKN